MQNKKSNGLTLELQAYLKEVAKLRLHLLVQLDRCEEIQTLLELAAKKHGVDPQHIGSHSLRFGGATALWAAYRDTGLVKRWGRWATDSFQTYVWEARTTARGVQDAMAAADFSLL